MRTKSQMPEESEGTVWTTAGRVEPINVDSLPIFSQPCPF